MDNAPREPESRGSPDASASASELMADQLGLERGMIFAGQQQARARTESKYAKDHAEFTAGGAEAIRRFLLPVIEVVDRFKRGDAALLQPLTAAVIEAKASRRGRPPGSAYRAYLDHLTSADIAMICIQSMIGGCARARRKSQVRTHLVRRLERAARLAAFESATGPLHKQLEKTNRAKSEDRRGRDKILDFAFARHVPDWTAWGEIAKHQLGECLIYAVCEHTGLMRPETIREQGKSQIYLVPTQPLLDLMKGADERAIFRAHDIDHFIIPPRKWTSPVSGAFWGPGFEDVMLVKKRPRKRQLDLLASADMTAVYRTVNAAQETAWRINTGVLEVVRWAWENADTLGGKLEQREPLTLPELLGAGASEDQWKARNAAARPVHVANRQSLGGRVAIGNILATAENLRERDQFFFCYNLDFRGRMYPIQSTLHPQGSNLEKGLLTFARGLPIMTTEARHWLAVHGANTWGEDKVSFQARAAWVEANENRIILCADAPLSHRWWLKAAKPFQFLAFCLEWAGLRSAETAGTPFVSHLPVSVDGTCNGLQHLSALTRDPIGANHVNLSPAETPQDVYRVVAEKATELLRAEVQRGGPNARLAGDLLEIGIDRAVTKQTVMTVPYGVSRAGAKDQIEDALRAKGGGAAYVERSKLAAIACNAIWRAMEEVLGPAREFMGWAQKAADAHTEMGIAIEWTTPSGFVAHQSNRVTAAKKVKAGKCGTIELTLLLQLETKELDKGAQRRSVAPNIVHSLDAAHMALTVAAARDMGINDFALVHDSYGTHAASMPAFHPLIAFTFSEMYRQPVMWELMGQLNGGAFGFQVELPPEGKTYFSRRNAGLDDTPPPLEDDPVNAPNPRLGQWEAASTSDSNYFFS